MTPSAVPDGDMEATRGSRPVPDPTELTDKAIAKAVAALTDHIASELGVRDERLQGIDRATELRLKEIDGLPGQIVREVSHLEILHDAKIEAERRFAAAEVAHLREVDDIRFQAAERLASRESELNALALAAAFAAQKEASAKEAEYTRIASVKSESAVAQAIDKLGELFATQTRGLGDKVDDLKDRVGRIESTKQGATENRTGLYAGIAAIAGILGILVTISILIAEAKP